jgi:hypothetical protein
MSICGTLDSPPASTVFRPFIVLVIFALSGCTASRALTGHEEDRFSLAAKSWEGANIVEMMAAWGPPNRREKPVDGENDGIAWWEYQSKKPVKEAHGSARYHCSALAHFNSNLIIMRIEVKHSRDCHRLFEGQFEAMTRPQVTSKQTPLNT